jgi:hypothetical protein
MRRLALVVLVVVSACSHHAATGPSWPARQEPEKDGGESIAPRESNKVAVAVEKSAGDEPKAADKPAGEKAADKAADKPASSESAPAQSTPLIDEPATINEEIIIDIDD